MVSIVSEARNKIYKMDRSWHQYAQVRSSFSCFHVFRFFLILCFRFTRWTGLGINMCKLDRGQLKSLQRVLLAAAVLLAGLNFTLTVYQQRIFKYIPNPKCLPNTTKISSKESFQFVDHTHYTVSEENF